MVRKAIRPVQLNDVISTAFEDDGSLLNPTLRGHLVIEALLVELITTVEAGDHIWKWGFPVKTNFALDHNLITGGIKQALDCFNDFRNDFAHIFGFAITDHDVHQLARRLEKHGVDFSDSVGHQPFKEAMQSYGGEAGILSEILWCLAFELAHSLMERGGRDLFST